MTSPNPAFETSRLGAVRTLEGARPWANIIRILLLGLAAGAINLHAPTVFFDSQIMLGGSIAVFALLQFGWPGLAVGVMALAATALRWGHPFELIIGTLFLVWLKVFLDRFNGGWSNRDNGRVVLAALGFWLVAGIALEALLFNRFFGLETFKALGLGLKEAVTAMVNTTLGLLAYLAVRAWGQRGTRGTLSARGIVFATILAAITIPGIGLSMMLSGQLKDSVLGAYLEDLRNFTTVAAADAVRGLAPRHGADDPQHAGMAFLARGDGGRVTSSDPALFAKLARDFEMEKPSRTGLPGLDILKPKSDAPVVVANTQSYWVTEFTMPDPGAENRPLRVTAVQGTPQMIRKLDYQLLFPSFALLFAIMTVGALASELLSRAADRQFKSVIGPLQANAPDQPAAELTPSKIRELDTIVSEVNERSRRLAESEQKYRNFFNLPLVGTAITSRTKGWVEVNDATCEILGYPREELFQKTWADITHPDDLAADEAQFARMLRREIDGYELEKRFIRKDGAVVHTLLAGGCGPIGDKVPETFYVNILDITERKRAESRLHDTLMNLPLPVACGSNHEVPAITLLNKAFTETFGYTREDIPTVQAWLEAAYPDPAYRAEIMAGWEAGMARGQREAGAVGVAEVRITCKDGSVRDAIFSATLTEDGPIVAFQDISQRKHLEEELAAAREREKQTEQEMRTMLEKKLKTSLNAAAVAHEINQPLSRILLRARLDLEKEVGADKDTLHALIADAERVVETIEKMKVLLRNVETVQQPVELATIVSSSLHQIKQPLRHARVKITRTIQESGCIVLGDEVQLQMILTNLLRNAIEAIVAAGSPKREISIGLACRESTVELVIGDSGPGWPGGTLEEMLLKTSKRDGSGIGLYVVKTAMENHHGRIEISRSPLGGAEFRMVFPTGSAS